MELAAKRLGLLHELLPAAARFAALVNPDNPGISEPFIREAQAAAAAIGRKLEVVMASTNSDIDAAFAIFANKGIDAFLISPEALFVTRRVQLVTLAARHAMPAIYHRREFADAGGLMSYGSSFADQFARLAAMRVAFLKASDRPTCRCSCQPSSSS